MIQVFLQKFIVFCKIKKQRFRSGGTGLNNVFENNCKTSDLVCCFVFGSFLSLNKNFFAVVSDSGFVQELVESCKWFFLTKRLFIGG